MSSSDQIEVPEREVVKANNNYTPDVARIKLFLVIVIESQKEGETIMNAKEQVKKSDKKIEYTKPVVLAATKNGSNFSAGCQTRTGMQCMTCRCS